MKKLFTILLLVISFASCTELDEELQEKQPVEQPENPGVGF